MLIKRPKSPLNQYKKFIGSKWFKRGAIALFVLEAAGFIFSYKVWTKLNTERDSRKYLKDNYPTILEGYYKIGEFLGADNRIREIDYSYWNAANE